MIGVYQRWVTNFISVSEFKDWPVFARTMCPKQHWFTTSFSGGGWTESCGAYGVGISNEFLKPWRVMAAEELRSSSCLLWRKYELQIMFLDRECLLHCPFQKWLLLQLLGSCIQLLPSMLQWLLSVYMYMLLWIGSFLNEKWSVLIIIQDTGINLNLWKMQAFY